jgi:dTDP-4-dehydrorhamnose 3,5-epimerase
VAVDLRRSSPGFGRWAGWELSEDNQRQIWIPPGFGHGFVVLSESADFLYKTTDYYAPEHERCLLWNDASVGVQWPTDGLSLTLSDKDRRGLPLAHCECFE